MRTNLAEHACRLGAWPPGLLGFDLGCHRASIHGDSGAGGVSRIHRFECPLARSHVTFRSEALKHNGRALIRVMKEPDTKRNDALRRASALIKASLHTVCPIRVDIFEADNSYVHYGLQAVAFNAP